MSNPHHHILLALNPLQTRGLILIAFVAGMFILAGAALWIGRHRQRRRDIHGLSTLTGVDKGAVHGGDDVAATADWYQQTFAAPDDTPKEPAPVSWQDVILGGELTDPVLTISLTSGGDGRDVAGSTVPPPEVSYPATTAAPRLIGQPGPAHHQPAAAVPPAQPSPQVPPQADPSALFPPAHVTPLQPEHAAPTGQVVQPQPAAHPMPSEQVPPPVQLAPPPPVTASPQPQPIDQPGPGVESEPAADTPQASHGGWGGGVSQPVTTPPSAAESRSPAGRPIGPSPAGDPTGWSSNPLPVTPTSGGEDTGHPGVLADTPLFASLLGHSPVAQAELTTPSPPATSGEPTLSGWGEPQGGDEPTSPHQG